MQNFIKISKDGCDSVFSYNARKDVVVHSATSVLSNLAHNELNVSRLLKALSKI